MSMFHRNIAILCRRTKLGDRVSICRSRPCLPMKTINGIGHSFLSRKICFEGGNERVQLCHVNAIGRRYCAKTFITANLLCNQMGQKQLSLLLRRCAISGKFSAPA